MPLCKLKDANIHYEIAGGDTSGPPVLFIQGTGVTGSAWGPQVEELSDDYQCLWFDNRGIGKSLPADVSALTVEQMARDTAGLMDHVGWTSAHIVGHSLGGLIAQRLALDAPERIRSLALLCTFTRGAEATRMTPGVMWMGMKTRLGTRAMRRRAFLQMLFTPGFLASQDEAALAERVATLVGRDLADSPAILMTQFMAMRAYDASDRLSTISGIPALVASAQNDPIALPEFGRALASLIAGSSYVEIPQASHGVTIQEPAIVNNLLRVHLDKAVTRASGAAPAERK